MVKTVSLVLAEGDIVWFQSHITYVPSEPVKVTSVGRLYAQLSNGYRCNRYTGNVDGGDYPSPGTVYLQKEDYDKEMALFNMWRRLQKDIANKRFLREDITRRRLLQVRRLLKLDE